MGLVSDQALRRLSPSRQDVWLGAGLVASLAVMVAGTSWEIDVPAAALTRTIAILAVAMGIDVLLFVQPWGLTPVPDPLARLPDSSPHDPVGDCPG